MALSCIKSEIKPDISRKLWFFYTPLAFGAAIRGVPVRILPSRSCGKTRMMGLPDGEKSLRIWILVLTKCTNATDRQTHTDTAWRLRQRLMLASCGKKHIPLTTTVPLDSILYFMQVYKATTVNTLGPFTFWISLSLSILLSPKFGLKPKISQKVKSFSLSNLLRPNFGLSDRWIQR